MGIKTFRPTTPTRRFQIISDFAEITKSKPEKNLTVPMRATGGRNNHGHITSRFRGGGHKRMYRIIDFYRRDKAGVEGTVLAIEYDPNRTSRLALIQYPNNERRYILWPEGLGTKEFHTVDSVLLFRREGVHLGGQQAEQ